MTAESQLEKAAFADFTREGSEVYDLEAPAGNQYVATVDLWRVLKVENDGSFWVLWRSPWFEGNDRAVHFWRIVKWRPVNDALELTDQEGHRWLVDFATGRNLAMFQEFQREKKRRAAELEEIDARQLESVMSLVNYKPDDAG